MSWFPFLQDFEVTGQNVPGKEDAMLSYPPDVLVVASRVDELVLVSLEDVGTRLDELVCVSAIFRGGKSGYDKPWGSYVLDPPDVLVVVSVGVVDEVV